MTKRFNLLLLLFVAPLILTLAIPAYPENLSTNVAPANVDNPKGGGYLRQKAVEKTTPQPGKPKALDAVGAYFFEDQPYEDAEIGDLLMFNNAINDKIQQGGANLNMGYAPNKITGDYRIGIGQTHDDFLWKDANADYMSVPSDLNYRYLYGRDRHNTYDKEIYSRLRVNVDSPLTSNLSMFNQVVIDPWTFVGVEKQTIRRVRPTAASQRDFTNVKLKYWSNSSRTINEAYRSDQGDIVYIDEIKVKDGEISNQLFPGAWVWPGFNPALDRWRVKEAEIHRRYVPLRKSWLEYKEEPYHVKAFAFSDQDEALTSDDPMRLSNNKVWWEESPWIDSYEPSRLFNRSPKGGLVPSGYSGIKQPLKKGLWRSNLAFTARDSDQTRLTFLRGVSVDANYDNGVSIKAVGATPLNLWDDYEQANSLPAAVRVKYNVTDRIMWGGTFTNKTGFRHHSPEAENIVGALDMSYMIFPDTELLMEWGGSGYDAEETTGIHNDFSGCAGKIGLKNKGDIITGGPGDRYEVELSYASMADDFFPGLSRYRYTRKEFEYAKHIYFDDINPAALECMIGDGMDVGRNAFNLGGKVEFPSYKMDMNANFRTVTDDGGNFIENMFRTDVTHRPIEKLELKGLFYYLHLPKTTRDVDPLINAKSSFMAFTDYYTYDDVWLTNYDVDPGLDPSIASYAGGLKYDFTDYLSTEGTFEVTNDPKDWSRGLLNYYLTDEVFYNNTVWDNLIPVLYGQGSFGLPPYEYYNIYKARVTYYPFDPLKVTLKYTYNENKYAVTVDDNATNNGIELEYKVSNRATAGFAYQYTRVRDLYKEFVRSQGYKYEGHHNFFFAWDYKLNDDQHLTLTYGDYLGYYYPYADEHDDIAPLDTRHILRIVYSGSWGGPYTPGKSLVTRSHYNALDELNPLIPGAEFFIDLGGGMVKYETEATVAPVSSEWDDEYARIEGGMEAFDREYFEGSIVGGLFMSNEEEEKWTRNESKVYQTNNMDFRGADINANFGWALSDRKRMAAFTPLLQTGYRRYEFERNDYVLGIPAVPQLGEVNEEFNIAYLGAGARAEIQPCDTWNFFGTGYWAPLAYTTIRNDAIGRITGTNGNIYHVEGGIDYNIRPRIDLTLGAFWDLQDIEEAQRIDKGIVSAEMPHNKMTTYGLKVGGKYKF